VRLLVHDFSCDTCMYRFIMMIMMMTMRYILQRQTPRYIGHDEHFIPDSPTHALAHSPPPSSKASNFTISTFKSSKSSSTTSPVFLKLGIATKRTSWPCGPSITLVSNLG
jgi:hypothetical protein